MKPLLKNILVTSVAASAFAFPALAQQSTFDNQTAATDAVDAIEDAVADDYARSDRDAFGNQSRALGWYGSVSATGTATAGNSDTANIGIGSRFGTYDGTNGHDFRLSYTYSEEDGEATASKGIFGYDYTRDINQNLFGYGKLSAIFDDDSTYERDVFVGAGLGYRVQETNDASWTLQAGPGYRLAETSAGEEIEEFAASVGSKAAFRLSETAFLTNDTDIIWSETDTLLTNDLGVNVRVSDALALRTSLLTTIHSEPDAGDKNTDHSLGVSLVYSFQ